MKIKVEFFELMVNEKVFFFVGLFAINNSTCWYCWCFYLIGGLITFEER